MARVNAKLYTTIGGKLVKDNSEIAAGSVAEVLEVLAQRYGREFRQDVYDGGEVKNYYIVLHNGQVIDRESPDKVMLSDGDTVHIFPPVSGG